MNLLTNFPFEMFGPRADFPFARIVTFGPAKGRRVGSDHFPYDVVFDPAHEHVDALLARLPEGFAPDALMLWWPDQEPLPLGLERSPLPVVGVLSDYNLTLPHLRRLWPFFDLLLCDRPGLSVLGRLPFARVAPWCQFSFRPAVHRIYNDEAGQPLPRDIDVCFVGNLNPVVQRERAPWIERLRRLGDEWHVHVGSAPQGEPYGRLLARSRIVFNRSVRGEVNLRAFEATAAGALLFMERENTEVRDFFREDEEVVLYGADDLEAKLRWFLTHEEERARIAAAGSRRVSQHTLARLCAPLPDLIRSLTPTARPPAEPLTLLLGRGEAMLATWADASAAMPPFLEAARRFPQSALAHNDLAVAVVHRLAEAAQAASVERLLTIALTRDPTLLAASVNLAWLYEGIGLVDEARRVRREALAILERGLPLASFDGLCLPLGFNSHTVSHATALSDTLRHADPAPLRAWFRARLSAASDHGPSPSFTPALVDLSFATA